MMDDIRREVESVVTPLVRDILRDAQSLFRQEWALAKTEVREDARRARDGAVALMVSLLTGAVAFLFVHLMLVRFLVEQYGWSSWASYGVVGIGLGCFSVAAAWWGNRRLRMVRLSLELPFAVRRDSGDWVQ